jgi:hypothetical protein
MRLPRLPVVPAELLGPLRRLVWAAHVLCEAVEEVLADPKQHLPAGRERALFWAADVVEQWIDHVGLQLEMRGDRTEVVAASRAAAAQQVMRAGAALGSDGGKGHDQESGPLASGREDTSLMEGWPRTPEQFWRNIRGLVNVGTLFRGILVTTLTHPPEEVLVKDADALSHCDEALNEWIDQVGVPPYEREEVVSESILLADAMRKAARGEFGEKSRSSGKGKRLRKGDERSTVKRR